MGWVRRLTLSVGCAVAAGAVLTIASVGAAGGFGFGAGTFTFTDTSAFVNAFNPVDGSSINVNVDRSTFMFKQRPGGALQTGVMTILSISQFVPGPDPTLPPTVNSVCLVIPDADFTVSSDLQTTKLNTTNQSTICPGFLVPITGAVLDGKGGGGGGGGSIPLPLDANVIWTGNGAVTVSVNNGTDRCLTFVSITHTHGQQGLSSSVTGTISTVGSFSGGQQNGVFGSVSANMDVQNVAGQGILPPPCGGKGG
jgi:hypothetical protein